jgi:hypothetical protein
MDQTEEKKKAGAWTGHNLKWRLRRCVSLLHCQDAIQNKTHQKLITDIYESTTVVNPPVEDWTGDDLDERLTWAACYLYHHGIIDTRGRKELLATLRKRGIGRSRG